MGRGGATEAGSERADSLASLFAENFLDPSADAEEAWEQLYLSRPGEFLALPDPVQLPTEWAVLAFLYAQAHGETGPVRFTQEEQRELSRARGILARLTGIPLPRTTFLLWHTGSSALAYYEAMRPSSCAFSLAAEPQLRSTIALKASWRETVAATSLARVCMHEEHHAAHAAAADPHASAYRQPLVAAVEELTVCLTEIVLGSELRGKVTSRGYLQAWVAANPGESLSALVEIALALTEAEEAEQMCRSLSSLAVAVLRDGSDEGAALLLNERCEGSARSLEGWRDAFKRADLSV